MQVRNRCRLTAELRDLTRRALDEITADYPHSLRFKQASVYVEDDAAPDDMRWLGSYRTDVSEDRTSLSMEVRLPNGCRHAWTFNAGALEMIGYWLVECRCTHDVSGRRRNTTYSSPSRIPPSSS